MTDESTHGSKRGGAEGSPPWLMTFTVVIVVGCVVLTCQPVDTKPWDTCICQLDARDLFFLLPMHYRLCHDLPSLSACLHDFLPAWQVRSRRNGQILAMKCISKKMLARRNHAAYMQAERDIMTKVHRAPTYHVYRSHIFYPFNIALNSIVTLLFF